MGVGSEKLARRAPRYMRTFEEQVELVRLFNDCHQIIKNVESKKSDPFYFKQGVPTSYYIELWNDAWKQISELCGDQHDMFVICGRLLMSDNLVVLEGISTETKALMLNVRKLLVRASGFTNDELVGDSIKGGG